MDRADISMPFGGGFTDPTRRRRVQSKMPMVSNGTVEEVCSTTTIVCW